MFAPLTFATKQQQTNPKMHAFRQANAKNQFVRINAKVRGNYRDFFDSSTKVINMILIVSLTQQELEENVCLVYLK